MLVKAFWAFASAFKCLAMVGLVVKPSYAGKSSWNGEGKFVFWPIASWDGVNPLTFKELCLTDTA